MWKVLNSLYVYVFQESSEQTLKNVSQKTGKFAFCDEK